MDFQKLTIKAQEAFASAQGDAISRGNPELTPDHLLLALLDQEGGVAPRILEKAGTNAGEVRAAAEAPGIDERMPGEEPDEDLQEAELRERSAARGRAARRGAPAGAPTSVSTSCRRSQGTRAPAQGSRAR